MKKIAPLFLVVLTYVIYSQDFDPTQLKFKIGNDSTYISSEHPTFKLRGFMLGVQWGATSKKISEALLIKQMDGRRPWDHNELQDSCDMFLPLEGQSHNMGQDFYNVRAMVFEPTLALDSLIPTKLVKRQGDTTKPVFGFLYRRGEVLTNPSDPNYNRLILQDTGLKGQLVLSNPWPNNELNMIGYKYHYSGLDFDNMVCDSFLCRTMYLSINMRSLDNNYPNDTILIIEAPYKIANSTTTGYINFSMLPSPNSADTATFPYGRGTYRKMDSVTSFKNKIYITRNMLPSVGKDITISASFTLRDVIGKPYLSNPILQHDHTYSGDPLTNLGINVTYVGRTAVAIDWIKYETPHARSYFSGKFDTIIKHNIDVLMLLYTSSQWTNRGIRPFRFVPVVESNVCHWASQRYFHKIVGNVTTKEEGAMFPEHYEYYVDPADRWIDVGGSFGAHISVPFCKKHLGAYDNVFRAMNLGHGYMGLIGDNPKFDSTLDDTIFHRVEVTYNYKTANYETMVPIGQFDLIKPTFFLDHPNDLETYMRALNTQNNGWGASPMMQLEGVGYGTYNNKVNSAYLYSEKPWWAHFFLMASVDSALNVFPETYDAKNYITFFNNHHRFFTPEEYKANAWMALIRGTKGLIYDGIESSNDPNKSQFYDGDCISPADKTSLEALPNEEFLKSDLAGPDYFRVQNEIHDLNRRAWFLDTMALFFERPKEKIYLGRKSMRWEVYKLHKYIRQVEPTLMNLRLQAHYMKGFNKWYNQHPKYTSDTIMHKFLTPSLVRTKHPFSRDYEGTPQYNYLDSSFYDVSILSDPTVDSNMNRVFYVGVLNRRTNPLVMEDDTLQFYPTYEWDRNVWHGGERLWGNFADSKYWQEKYWQRMGCREIRIPFMYSKNVLSNSSTVLRISELGAEDTVIRNFPWRAKNYYHFIDTIISRDGELVLRMLPGEGKFLKVEVCNATYDFTGNLDRSNQKKVVGYPLNSNEDLSQTGTGEYVIKYHAAYYKNNVGTPPKSRAFYMGSLPTARRFPNETIFWTGHETRLFDSVRVLNRSNGRWDTIYNPECKYPSIVVRWDPTVQKAKAYITAVITALPAGVDSISYGENMVVEAILTNLNDYYPSYVRMPEVIAHVSAARDRKITDFAIPTINASAEGNFYAWADSLAGIRVGFKRPHETQFAPNNIISFRWFSGNNTRAVDPSLNTYSKIRWGENDCSVVWSERDTLQLSDTVTDIYYTQVYWDGAALRRELPRKNAYIFWASYNSDKTMILLSKKYNMPNPEYQTRQNRFPVIYRAIDENTDLCPGCPPQMQTLERVYWQGKDIQYDEGNPRRAVFYVAIDQYDSLYNNKWYPNAWSVQTLYDIMSPSKSLYFPDAAQGRLVGRKANNDSAMHLNFVALADSSNPEIWHISHGWWSMMSVNDFPTLMNDFEDYKYARKVGPGVYPHLAAFPYVYDESYRWYNRRIFNNTFPNSTAKALSSVKWVFNKEGIDEEPDEKFYAFFGYRKDSTLRIIHSQPMLNRSGRSHKIAFSKEIDVKTLSMRDTLYSDWFEIDDIAIMEFIQANKSDKKSKYFIENQKGQKIEIGKIPMPSKAFNKRKIALTKGGGKAYRALWVKPEGAQYFEEGVIGNFESAAETMEGLNKSGMDELNEIEFVNLSAGQSNYENTLEIYPNPAESELYFNSNSLAVVEVYDLMGKCQMRFLDLKEPKIEVGALPAGVYILKVGVLQQKFIKY